MQTGPRLLFDLDYALFQSLTTCFACLSPCVCACCLIFCCDFCAALPTALASYARCRSSAAAAAPCRARVACSRLSSSRIRLDSSDSPQQQLNGLNMPAARVWGPWGRSGTCRAEAGRRVSGVRVVVCASSRPSL
jgi:hypothetical protein